MTEPSPSPSPAPAASPWSMIRPKEHGSWAFVLEPIALGLLAAASWSGVALALAAVAGFLTRRPLQTLAHSPDPAVRFDAFGLFAKLAALALVCVWLSTRAAGWQPLWPLLLSLPFGGLFLFFDLSRRSREGAAELCGAAAFVFVPASLALFGGWDSPRALTLAALMLARSFPTVLMVRTYVRRRKGLRPSPVPAYASAFAALALAVALAATGHSSWFAAGLVAALLLRTWFYLGSLAPDVTATTVGIREAVTGAIYVIMIGLTS